MSFGKKNYENLTDNYNYKIDASAYLIIKRNFHCPRYCQLIVRKYGDNKANGRTRLSMPTAENSWRGLLEFVLT